MVQTRAFCWTHNNYNDGDDDKIAGAFPEAYTIVGREVGEKGTPHLQGYTHLGKRKTIKSIIKKMHSIGLKPHIEAARGSPKQNIDYCSKQGDVKEYGERPKQGNRMDLEKYAAAIKDGATEIELIEEFTLEHSKFHKWGDRVRAAYKTEQGLDYMKKEMEKIDLKQWQRKAVKHLENQNDRQVTWVVDEEGGRGKTTLAKSLIKDGAFYVQGGKTADIAYAYGGQETVVFDFTRDKQETVNYSVIESFKNGILFSPKYESQTKIFKPCRVIVFSNWWPDESRLSADRWDIMHLH